MDSVLIKLTMVKQLSKRLEISVLLAENLINTLTLNMIDSFDSNEEVKIANFGVWRIKHKKERIGRNPTTKEKIVITERRVVVFHVAKQLRKRMNK